MFVRFRSSPRRLDLSLVEATRRDGKPRQEHVASLGSIAQPPTVGKRFAFWAKLHERLAKLANRIDAETHGSILGAVHERIPMVTADEQRQAQATNAQAEAKTWEVVADWYGSTAEESKQLVVSAERTVRANKGAHETATELAQAASARAAGIESGEIAGSFRRPQTLTEVLIEMGFTKAQLRHMRRSAEMMPTEEAFQAVLAERRRRKSGPDKWLPRDDAALAATVAKYRAQVKGRADGDAVENLNASNDE